MELRHLRYFVAAAEEEHFGRAAERVHVTRPAVSQIISGLEDELGIRLFERTGRHIKLTAAGRALYPRTRAVLDDLSDALILAQQIGNGKRGTLNIGHGSLALKHPVFRAAIKQYYRKYPDVQLRLLEIPSPVQPLALSEGKIHAGFIVQGRRPDGGLEGKPDTTARRDETLLDFVQIQSGGLGVGVAHDHPLAKRKSVSLKELIGEKFIVVPRSSSSPGYGLLSALCQKSGFEPEVVQEVQTVMTQQNLVSMGLGVGLAALQKDFSYPTAVAIIPLDDVEYETKFSIGWMRGNNDPLLGQMLDIVRELVAPETKEC